MTSFSEITARQAWKMQIEKMLFSRYSRLNSTTFTLKCFSFNEPKLQHLSTTMDYDRPVIMFAITVSVALILRRF